MSKRMKSKNILTQLLCNHGGRINGSPHHGGYYTDGDGTWCQVCGMPMIDRGDYWRDKYGTTVKVYKGSDQPYYFSDWRGDWDRRLNNKAPDYISTQPKRKKT